MKGSLRLGQAFGIGVFVHWSFALLLAYVVLSALFAGAGIAVAFNGLVFVCAVFACVVLHEFGHSLAARRYGIGTHDITLLPIGGVARLMRMPDDPKQELVIAIAGPAVNVAIAAMLSLFAVVLGKPPAAELVGLSSGTAILYGLIWANAILVVFNLIPAFPMDGGRVFRALVAMRRGMLPATELAVRVGKFFAAAMFVAAFFVNPFLFLTAAFVYVAGEAELRAIRQRFLDAGDSAEQIMRRAMAAFGVADGFVLRDEPKPVRGRVIDA